MNLRCAAYRVLDRFRKSPIASWLFYHGQRVMVLQDVCTVDGVVVRVVGNEADGDVTFNIVLDDGSYRHCEITPCAPEAIRRIAFGLPIGARVRVSGEERYDPPHLLDGSDFSPLGWREVHPVTRIEVLSWARKS
jgi:hypothetical protein